MSKEDMISNNKPTDHDENDNDLQTDTKTPLEMSEKSEKNEQDEADLTSTSNKEVAEQPMQETEIPLINLATGESDTEVKDNETIAHEEVTSKLSEIDEKVTNQDKVYEDTNNNLTSMLEEIATTQQQIQNDFQAKLKYDEHKELTINTLHRELQEYKDDIVKSTMKPLINDLIFVNDNIYKLVENLRSSEDSLDPEKILTLMESITTDIDNVLFRQGIESYMCPDEKVDMRRQTIFQTVPINDETMEKHIANRVRKGYEWDEKIIRKESVSVYVHDDSVSEEEEDTLENVEAQDNPDNEGADKHE